MANEPSAAWPVSSILIWRRIFLLSDISSGSRPGIKPRNIGPCAASVSLQTIEKGILKAYVRREDSPLITV